MNILGKINIISRLKKNNLCFKLLIGLVFWFCLSLVLHFKQTRYDILELNSFAPKYIVAQVDFEFPDDEATIILKQKNMSDVNLIYFINAKEIKQKRLELEKYLIENNHWKKFPNVTYEKINDIAEVFQKILINSRFTDAKTIKKMKRFKIDVSDYFALNLVDKNDLTIPKGYFSILAKKLDSKFENLSHEVTDYVTEFFEKNEYFIRADHLTGNKIKKTVERSIPQQYTFINAGERIIDYKGKVTSRHIAMLQAMKEALSKKINLFHPIKIFGNIFMGFIILFLSVLYFKIEQPKLLRSFKELSLIVTILILTLFFAKILEYFILKSSNTLAEAFRYPIIVPFAALLFCILFNPRISLFLSFLITMILSLTLAVEHSSFLIINLITSLIVIIATRNLRRRTGVFKVCAKCMLGVMPVILAYCCASNGFACLSFFSNVFSSFITLLIIGTMVVGFLPVLETFFDVLTDITLMEYMDPNNELLRRLTLEIPGSYQHSLVLGNIAETAASEIKANALFCRVATLYHDIGKLINPNYFIENQTSKINIHQLLTPLESAQIIISHVFEGEMLAKKYRLPRPIIDIIKQHHGTTLVYYFYRKELDLKNKDLSKLDENNFRYPGPKPKTKEAAIIMIADAVEAASRSVDNVSEKSLTALVDKIVKERADDGQFDDCCLTFEELKMVKESILKTLVLTRHIRIKYPEITEEKLGIYLTSHCVDQKV